MTRLLSSVGTPDMLHVRASAWPGMAENVMVSPKSMTCRQGGKKYYGQHDSAVHACDESSHLPTLTWNSDARS